MVGVPGYYAFGECDHWVFEVHMTLLDFAHFRIKNNIDLLGFLIKFMLSIVVKIPKKLALDMTLCIQALKKLYLCIGCPPIPLLDPISEVFD